MSKTRISLDLPEDWHKAIKHAATEAGYPSVAEYIRIRLIASDAAIHAASSVPLNAQTLVSNWGGKREALPIVQNEPTQAPIVARDKPATIKGTIGRQARYSRNITPDDADGVKYAPIDE